MDEYMDQLLLSIFESVRDPLNPIELNELADKAWKKMVAGSLMRLIDEGKVIHRNNRYFKGAN